MQSVRPLILGHALWEKCRHPYIGMTAKCLVVQVEQSDFTAKDHYHLANQLVPRRLPLRPKHLLPLPF